MLLRVSLPSKSKGDTPQCCDTSDHTLSPPDGVTTLSLSVFYKSLALQIPTRGTPSRTIDMDMIYSPPIVSAGSETRDSTNQRSKKHFLKNRICFEHKDFLVCPLLQRMRDNNDSHRVHIMVGTVRNPGMVKHMEGLCRYMQIICKYYLTSKTGTCESMYSRVSGSPGVNSYTEGELSV